jgi:hypothetical protein
MASKYAKILAQLPRFLGEEPAYQAKVNAVVQAMKDDPDFRLQAPALTRTYVDIRAEKTAAEAIVSEINLRLAALEQLLAAQYEAEGTSTVKLSTGEAVAVQPEPYSVVEDRAQFHRWCIENGYEQALTLPWMTMNSLTKQRLLDGDTEPAGIKCYVRDKFVLRGTTK